jgi:enediyne biosynthesis protein E3
MSLWGALRRRILTPDISATRLDVRGFHIKSIEARATLESIGRMFLTGYGYAAEARSAAESEEKLERVFRPYRGFAYEGAGMAFAVRDGLPLSRSGHVAEFFSGRADAHIYMTYVGIGWGMARLPRFRWRSLYLPDPILRWLALDGYGFHQTYFKTDLYVRQQFQEPDFPWPAGPHNWYANRAIDQGIGRAVWFVCGAAPALVVQTLDSFPEHRRSDLYSGAGLAATYAGGATESELREFYEAAGSYRANVSQGAAFAAGARVRADLVVPHNELATQVLCGMSTTQAGKVADENVPDEGDEGEEPLFEIWRQRITNEFPIGR